MSQSDALQKELTELTERLKTAHCNEATERRGRMNAVKEAIAQCNRAEAAEAEVARLKKQSGALAYDSKNGYTPLGEIIVNLEAEVARLKDLSRFRPAVKLALLKAEQALLNSAFPPHYKEVLEQDVQRYLALLDETDGKDTA